MHTFLKVTAAAALLTAGACASPPAPVEEPPPFLEKAQPVVEEIVEVVETPPVTSSIAPGSLEDFRVNVGERVYFDLDQYRLDTEDQDILKRQAAWLASYPDIRILVAGNADERGSREYNLALGQKRAEAVRKSLSLLGVAEAQIEAVSLGEEKPSCLETSEECMARNRRGDMLYTGEF